MGIDRRIRRDARLLVADPEAAALFECLAEHLFDPDLDTSFMGRVCGAPRQVRDRLAARIGPLKDYVTELRMTEAAHLVRDTEAPIREIGPRLGYRVTRTFRRVFHHAHGVNPSEMRQQARAPGPAVAESAASDEHRDAPEEPGLQDERLRDEEHLTPRAQATRFRRQMALGLLDPHRATELRFRLRRRHPGLDEKEVSRQAEPAGPRQAQEQVPVVLRPTGDHLEEIAADTVFGRILGLPDADLRFALLDGVMLGNTTAFHCLHLVCARLVQWNAERALMMAELAVQLIESHRRLMGDESDDWKALAWTFLGRVQTIAGHYAGADQSLGFARAEIGGDDGFPPWVEIEVRRVEGGLRKRQRRHEAAERALDRAVELGRELGACHKDRLSTVLERLELASALSDSESGLRLAQELEGLVEECDGSPRAYALWHGFVAYHRAKAHSAGGDDGQAEACLKQAEAHVAKVPADDTGRELGIFGTFVSHDLARLACRGDRLAEGESLLRTAVAHYRRLEIPVFEAAAEAELAVVCALRGQRAEARRLAAAAAAFLDCLPLHREAWNVARQLRVLEQPGAETSERELKDLLETLRHDLDLVAWEIAGASAVPAARAKRAWT